jgi:hypothetical protein
MDIKAIWGAQNVCRNHIQQTTSKEKGKKQARNQLIRDLILAKEWRKVWDSFEISNLADGLIFLELYFFFTSFSFRTVMS